MGAKCQQKWALWPSWPHAVHNCAMLEPAEASNLHDARVAPVVPIALVPWTPVLEELLQQPQNRHPHILMLYQRDPK